MVTPQEFYRYEKKEFEGRVDLRLIKFNLHKETERGYWIGYGSYIDNNKLRSNSRFIRKVSKKRYAYPTKEEALNNFLHRTKKHIDILKYQLVSLEIVYEKAKLEAKEMNLESEKYR